MIGITKILENNLKNFKSGNKYIDWEAEKVINAIRWANFTQPFSENLRYDNLQIKS